VLMLVRPTPELGEEQRGPPPVASERGRDASFLGERPDSLVRSVGIDRFNDPSAGSPTETLLRLLLPLGGRV
jgi:hypothetical protein